MREFKPWFCSGGWHADRFLLHPLRSLRSSAFTLLEVMIVVSIIALLAAMAMPSLMLARQRSAAARFLNDLRVATDAFHMYAVENGRFPADVNRATLPAGMATYLGRIRFTEKTPIGGHWDWDKDVLGIASGISVVDPELHAQAIADLIDARMDNGDVETGSFRRTQATRFTSVIE